MVTVMVLRVPVNLLHFYSKGYSNYLELLAIEINSKVHMHPS